MFVPTIQKKSQFEAGSPSPLFVDTPLHVDNKLLVHFGENEIKRILFSQTKV